MDQEQTTKRCPYCGEEINIAAIKCKHCGEWLEVKPANQPVVTEQERPSNGIGTAGFVLSLIACVLNWIPVLDIVLWFLGLLFSFIGVFKKPRGLAIAGLIISLFTVILLILAFTMFADIGLFSDILPDLEEIFDI